VIIGSQTLHASPNYAFERTANPLRYRLNVGRAAAQRER
jgi:hypothetical protein